MEGPLPSGVYTGSITHAVLIFFARCWSGNRERRGIKPRRNKKISTKNSPEAPYTSNPHNMYILVLVQLGIVGLLSMLSIMYYQIKLSFKGSNRFFRDVGFALPLLFLVIMWSDSYLLGHFTGLLFVFFSSFLYKGFEKS